MMLTKDEDKWISHYNLPDDIVDKILKNQEDAEKWNEIKTQFGVSRIDKHLNDEKIVERLKKRLKSRQDYEEPIDPDKFCNDILIEELQKILKDKK